MKQEVLMLEIHFFCKVFRLQVLHSQTNERIKTTQKQSFEEKYKSKISLKQYVSSRQNFTFTILNSEF